MNQIVSRANHRDIVLFRYKKHKTPVLLQIGGYLLRLLTGCQWFHTTAMFLHNKNSPSTNVHGCTFVDDVSASSIFKSAGAYKLSSGYQFLPFIGRVFSVSEAAWMPLVPRRNKFALQTCSSRMYTDVHS